MQNDSGPGGRDRAGGPGAPGARQPGRWDPDTRPGAPGARQPGRWDPDARSGARQPDWHGWQGDPDDLWPPFEGPVSRLPDPPTPGERRAEQLAAKMHDGRRRGGPDRGRLTRAQIVDAAIAIADAEGAEALSMRRIAQVLRAGTMSLYWHISSKEQLLDLMRDMLMAEVVVPEPSGDWRADLWAIASSTREMLKRHAWLMDFTGGRPPLGPTTLLWLESSLATLDVLKLDLETAARVLESVTTYVQGAVLREVQEDRVRQAEREFEARHQGDLRQAQQGWRDRLADTGLFPRFVQFLDAGIDPDAAETVEGRFEFGLDCLLDGIARRYGDRNQDRG
jgi:AcrR family transcriptional regulator